MNNKQLKAKQPILSIDEMLTSIYAQLAVNQITQLVDQGAITAEQAIEMMVEYAEQFGLNVPREMLENSK